MATIPTVFIQEAPTKMQGQSFILEAGQSRRFSGGPAGYHRKQIIVTNEDNSDKLYISIGDPDAASPTRSKTMTIFPNSSITIFTSDDVTLYNPSGSADINLVQVIEVFYTGAGNLVV